MTTPFEKDLELAEHQIGVILGDVARHGIGSALVMALCIGLFAESAKQSKTLANLFEQVNTKLLNFIKHSQIAYVTASDLLINPTTHTITIAQAGHQPVLKRTIDGHCVELKSSNSFLGFYEDEGYTSIDTTLLPGDDQSAILIEHAQTHD